MNLGTSPICFLIIAISRPLNTRVHDVAQNVAQHLRHHLCARVARVLTIARTIPRNPSIPGRNVAARQRGGCFDWIGIEDS